jgi:hypothetical protein
MFMLAIKEHNRINEMIFLFMVYFPLSKPVWQDTVDVSYG